jgi:hypothetical protein
MGACALSSGRERLILAMLNIWVRVCGGGAGPAYAARLIWRKSSSVAR